MNALQDQLDEITANTRLLVQADRLAGLQQASKNVDEKRENLHP